MKFVELDAPLLAKKSSELITNSMLSRNTQRSPKNSFPVIVGAGISVSAGIPASNELINALARLCPNIDNPSAVRKYEEILEALKNDVASNYEGDDVQYKIKVHFAPLLNKGGIPRMEDRPLPNMSNLIIFDLLLSGVVGPVISLNVDPLLEMSELLSSTDRQEVSFIHNVSQFSSADEDSDGRLRPTVFQPHGTIEEPFSLRFSRSELVSRSLGVISTIKKYVVKTSGALVVGANLTDDVVVEMLTTIAKENIDNRISIILPLFSEVFDQESMNTLKLKFSDQVGNAGEGITIYYSLNTDSDAFFRDMRKCIVDVHSHRRKNGAESASLPSFSEIELRHFIYRDIIEDDTWGERQVKVLPSLEKQVRTEVFIFAIASRGPFTLGALVQWLQAKKYLARAFDENANSIARYMQASLDALDQEGVLQANFESRHFLSFESIRSKTYKRGRVFDEENTKEKLSEIFLKIISASVSNGNIASNLGDLITKLEMNREGVYDPSHAFSVAIGFRGAEIIDSHICLDKILDKAKLDFQNWVKNENKANCRIMTESGDHLFIKDRLNEFSENPDRLNETNVRETLRTWLYPIFDAGDDCKASLRVIVAQQGMDWSMRDSARSRFQVVLGKALQILSARPRIRVYFSPWEKHDDHMLMISGELKNNVVSRAIAFPRTHGEIKFYGFKTIDNGACKEIAMLFDRNLVKNAVPIEKMKSLRPVMAVTIVDATASNYNGIDSNTSVYVAVRSDEHNVQHKGVASVPTRRIVENMLWEIVRPSTYKMLDASDEVLLDSSFENSGEGSSESSPVVMAVDYLLSRKLGMGEALESGDVKFRARPVILKAGQSPLISDHDIDEWLLMVNILVEITAGKAYFPKSSKAYSSADWISVGEFLEAVPSDGIPTRTRTDKKIKFGSGDEFEYICGGLCVCTSTLLLKTMIMPPASQIHSSIQ